MRERNGRGEPRWSAVSRWAPVVLRVIVGYGFVAHGVAKVARGSDAFAAILHAMGVPAATAMAWLTIMVEISGGVAVLLGALVRFASAPMAAVLLVAMFTVHLPYGFSSVKLIAVIPGGAQFGPPGYEVDLLYLACLAALVVGGPGPLAVDEFIRRRTRPRTFEGFGARRWATRTRRPVAPPQTSAGHTSCIIETPERKGRDVR